MKSIDLLELNTSIYEHRFYIHLHDYIDRFYKNVVS